MSMDDNAELRRQRLLALLPAPYAAQPDSSVVGALLSVWARALGRLDEAQGRVLEDRWLPLASGQGTVEHESALQQLAALRQIERLVPRVVHQEMTWQEFGQRLWVRFSSVAERCRALQEASGQASVALAPHEIASAEIQACLLLTQQHPGLQFTLLACPATQPGQGEAVLQVVCPGAAPPTAPTQSLDPCWEPWLDLLEPESAEAFRQRVQLTTAVLRSGLTTPRALLSLAVVDLGGAPCPRLHTEGDCITALGLPLESRQNCPGPCTRTESSPCPQAQNALFRVELLEQPVQASVARPRGIVARQDFSIENNSLVADRPILALRVQGKGAWVRPGLQSRTTGEVVQFDGTLAAGQTLWLYPCPAEEQRIQELSPFDTAQATQHHTWLLTDPQGVAWLEDANGQRQRLTGQVRYLRGHRLDDPACRLGGSDLPAEQSMRLGAMATLVRTPQLLPGQNFWVAHTGLLIGEPGQTTASTAPAVEDATQYSIEVQWLRRPPFSLKLQIPLTPWVVRAQRRGAIALLEADLRRIRPAGTHLSLDFPELPLQESHGAQLSEPAWQLRQQWSESAAPGEPSLTWQVNPGWREPHPVGEGRLGLTAPFDEARLDWALLK